jgi:transcriptional regulator with XRE-family HTH domain
VNELLERLGKRVQELRVSKGWSQEQFAHVCGLHRTYVGQIERAEKNISFENLTKLSAALGIALADLLSGLEDGTAIPIREGKSNPELLTLEVQRLVRRLSNQQAAIQKTVRELLEITGSESVVSTAASRSAKLKKK